MDITNTLVSLFAPLINYVAAHHRSLAMVVVVLPLSFFLRLFLKIRSGLWHLLYADPKNHDQRVRRIQEVVMKRQALPSAQRRPMCTARAAWQNLSTRFADYKKESHCVYVGDLRNILFLDEHNQTVTVEPLVDTGTITRFLVSRGWMLATTLEIEEATIGGLAMAVGMTTASHKYGLLQETITEWEVVLGDGRLVRATKENEHADLWHALPWSHGSLGFLVGLTLKIVPVKPFVRCRYTVFESQEGYCSHIRALASENEESQADFVEATVFAPERAVVMEARFSDGVGEDSSVVHNDCSWWWKPLFFKHVEHFIKRARTSLIFYFFFCSFREMSPCRVRIDPLSELIIFILHYAFSVLRRAGNGEGIRTSLSKAESCNGGARFFEELIPTFSYIFRHNRAIFWTVCDQLPENICNHPLFRLCLGWMMPPMVTFLKLPATPAIREEMMTQRVYQDIVLPIRTLESALAKAGSMFGVWPILVYPSRIYDHGPGRRGVFPTPAPEDIIEGTNYAMYYDLGVYGIPAGAKRTGASVVSGKYQHVHTMRAMEDYTSSVQGAPFLYADTFMTRDAFNEMFNVGPTSVYGKARKKYAAEENFPDVFSKTTNRADIEGMLAREKKHA